MSTLTGSKLKDQVGAGVYILCKEEVLATHKVRLPDECTVYQAELMAVKQAAIILQNHNDLTTLKFFVDSQAALRTFQADFLKSKLAFQTIEALVLVKHQLMIFVWTKAHVGTPGNEEADELAKEGITLDHITPTPVPACSANNLVDMGIPKLWQTEWDRYPQARQSKLYYPKIDKNKASKTIQWTKMQLGRLIRATTGHNNLLYHLYNMDNHISDVCRFCLEGQKEFQHLANDCPELWWERHIINAQDPEHSTPKTWSPHKILDFTLFPKINEAFIRPLYLV